MTPRWSGTATITDAIDGSPATLSTQLEKGWSLSNRRDWVSVQTVGTKITAAIVSQLSTSVNVKGRMIPVDQSVDQSVGQQLGFTVVAGRSYTVTKYVGVVSSPVSGTALGAAQTRAGAPPPSASMP